MERHVAHLDLDTFFVSVERLRNSALAGKPVIVGGFSDRGVVAACSYETRAFGVHSAMPMRMARQLCPTAIIIRGDMDAYLRYSQLVTDIISDRAPVVEKASIDEHYLDLTGMDKRFGCARWLSELRETVVAESGLPISFGLASNKTVAKIATGVGKPNARQVVEQGREKLYLSPLSVKRIPGVGDKTFTMLRALGVTKIQTLQQLPPPLLQKTFGENGLTLWRKANGIDPTPVESLSGRQSISEEHTFEADTTDMDLLQHTVMAMADSLAFELRKSQKLTACVTVKIRYSDFETHTKQCRVMPTADDPTLVRTAVSLFGALYSRRQLIRLVGVKCSALSAGRPQIDLFADSAEQVRLAQAVDAIRLRYGETAILRAAALSARTPSHRRIEPLRPQRRAPVYRDLTIAMPEDGVGIDESLTELAFIDPPAMECWNDG